MRKIVRTTVLALAVVGLASPAFALTFLQFTQISFNTPFVFTNNVGNTATSVSASAIVNVIFDPNFCLVAGCGGNGNGLYDLSLTAASTSLATQTATDISQNYAGTIAITRAGGTINLLTVNFSDLFTGPVGGSSNISMGSAQPPDTFSGSSTVLDPAKIGIPRGFALSFSNFSPGLAVVGGPGIGTGGTVRSAVADATGTFNATAVPEPASLLFLGTGLIGLASNLRRRMRK